MPSNTQQDIDFQPKTKEFSYSTKGGASKKYGIYLLVGIVILIIILLSALLYLNNSGNIKTATKNQVNLQKKTQNTLLVNDPKFKNYTKLANQATDAQMTSYVETISQKGIPLDIPEFPEEIYGIFSGFDDKSIQIVTYNGIENLAFAKDLSIQKPEKIEKSATSSAITVGFSKIDNNSFFNQTMFGKILHLTITPTTPETVLQIYLTENIFTRF